MAPPRNRTKLYPADATGRGTGEMFMAVSVNSVLSTPSGAPQRITRVVTTGALWTFRAIAASSTVNAPSAIAKATRSPTVRRNHGAPHTAQMPSSTPPASIKEVAERYGRLFAEVDRRWQERVIASLGQLGAGGLLVNWDLVAGLPDRDAE